METIRHQHTTPVLGFDLVRRCWLTEAEAGEHFAPLPLLAGVFITDPAVLATFSSDYGHLIHHTPLAVCQPASVDDVVQIVGFASKNKLRITCRGTGHTGFGQSQVEAGIVLDMRQLNRIHSVTSDHAVVDAGVIWRDLLQISVPAGLTPPILTDYTRLTVGGTLSVGGISGRSYQYGAQVDNVLELQVVTAEGQLLTCSEASNRPLFEAVLAGLGLTAIIVRATIKLIAAKERACTWRLFYPDAVSMLSDIRQLISQSRFDHIRGNSAPTPDGFVFFIEATSFYTSPADLPHKPTDGLQFIQGLEQMEDRTYLEYTDIVVELIDTWTEQGFNHLPNPWLDLFVPDSVMDQFTLRTMASLDPAHFLPGTLLLFFPFVRSKITRPMLRVPDEEVFFLFDVLRNVPADPAIVNTVLADNRQLYEQNRDLGGSFYTISAVVMEPHDWQMHFGNAWDNLVEVKQQYDPENILGAGLRVFQ